LTCFFGFGRQQKSKKNPRSEKSVIKMRNALILFSLVIVVFLGGCVSTGSQFLPTDTVTFLTTDYRFKEVMKSNDDVKGWARDALQTINELQYQLEVERNK
jgi:hypothetical protein